MLEKDSIINTLVTVTSAEDLRIKKAFSHLSSPAIHKQISLKRWFFSKLVQTAVCPDLSLLFSRPLILENEEQVTNGVRPAERTLRDVPPVSSSAHLCKRRWPLCGRAAASLRTGGDVKWSRQPGTPL